MPLGLTIDLLAVALVVGMATLGWFRGLISQVVTIGAAVALWLTADQWAGPVGDQLVFLGDAWAEHGFLRRMTAGLLLYFAIVLAVLIVERLVVQKFGPLKLSNHWLGAVLGGAKGVVYGAIAIWIVQTIALWEMPPDEEPPGWLTESRAAATVAPYNPVRLFSLQELIEEAVERVQAVAAADDDDDSAARERPRTTTRPMRARTRKAIIEEAPPVKVLITDEEERRGLDGKSWGQLARDPRVRRILADPEIRDLLYGS